MSIETAFAIAGMWLGLLLALVFLLGATWLVAWVLMREVWTHLKTTYDVSVMAYWLNKLEKEGWRVFPKNRTFTEPEPAPKEQG